MLPDTTLSGISSALGLECHVNIRYCELSHVNYTNGNVSILPIDWYTLSKDCSNPSQEFVFKYKAVREKLGEGAVFGNCKLLGLLNASPPVKI